MSRTVDRRPDRSVVVREMFDRIAPRYERLNRLLTFGLDARWRRSAVAALDVPSGSVVLDVACGTGDLCRELERTGQRAIGVDLSAGMLGQAGVSLRLMQGDGLALPVATGVADAVTCGFALRNVVDVKMLLTEMGRILRPGGRMALLEVAEPEGRVARRVHGAYFRRVVPVIGGVLSDREAYRYLPESTMFLPSPTDLPALVTAAGFQDYERRLVGMGAAQLITATRSVAGSARSRG